MNKARDDYRLQEMAAGQRYTSPGIDLGQAILDIGTPSTQTNLLSNPGFETGTTGWTVNSPDGTVRSADPAPFDGGQYYFAGPSAVGFAEQIIDLGVAGYSTTELDSLSLDVLFGGRVRAFTQTPLDHGRIIVTFLDDTETPISFTHPVDNTSVSQWVVEASDTSSRWQLLGDRLALPTGTRKIVYRFESIRNSGTNNDSYLDNAFVYLISENVAPDTGAYGHNAADMNATNPQPHIALRFPELYTDWERDKPHTIRWEAFNNPTDSPVRIDLYQDGPSGPLLLTTIANVSADDGSYVWIPASSGIDFGTYGLRIQVSLVDNPAVFDRSTETFTVPEDGNQYYVDDQSDTNDEYTVGAIGDNRHTGKLSSAPKPNPVNLLRTYDLGVGDVLNIDSGGEG